MFYVHGAGWGWWLLMSIGMIAFWALMIYGILWLIRSQSPRGEERAAPEPEQILKRRLARGEVSIEEYERLHVAIHEAPHEPMTA